MPEPMTTLCRIGRLLAGTTLVLATCLSMARAEPVDHLGVPGPVTFAGTDYALAWTAEPTPTYTKQEYLPAGQDVATYAQMLLIELVQADVDVRTAIAEQVKALDARKPTDPLVHRQILENPANGEKILDFLVSQKDQNGDYIVEWNAYRYVPYEGPDGDRAGVMLFAISHRAYGNAAAKAFLGGLKELRASTIEALAMQKLPEVELVGRSEGE